MDSHPRSPSPATDQKVDDRARSKELAEADHFCTGFHSRRPPPKVCQGRENRLSDRDERTLMEFSSSSSSSSSSDESCYSASLSSKKQTGQALDTNGRFENGQQNSYCL